MPRRTRSTDPEVAARDKIGLEIERMVNTLSSRAGPAADATTVSADKQLQQWGQTDPKIMDPDGLKQHLMTQGLPQEMLDPNSPQCLAMIKANPDLAQDWAGILSSPLDERMADLVTPLIVHPLRLAMLRPFEDDPEAMVKFSDSMDARWGRELERRMGGQPTMTDPEQDTNANPPGGDVAPPQQTPPTPQMQPDQTLQQAPQPVPALMGG